MPHTGKYEPVGHVKLGGPVLEAPVLAVLRLLECSDVDAVAGSAGGEMVH